MGKSILVKSVDEIRSNLTYLESYRQNPKQRDYKKYTGFISRGKNYLAYSTANGMAFAPSRLIGYKSNSFAKHENSENKDGGETTRRISKLLRVSPKKNNSLEQNFLNFCNSLDATPENKKRKFWDCTELEFLDLEFETILNDKNLSDTEKLNLVKSRRGQGIFREKLLNRWKKCCVTGSQCEIALRASHIKPWSKSNNREKLDVNNGLLLTANLDALFDRGLITFSDEGKMIKSKFISESEFKLLGYKSANSVKLNKKNLEYMKYHRHNIFKK